VQKPVKKYLVVEGDTSALRGPHLATMLRQSVDFTQVCVLRSAPYYSSC
jgi:hypothetical protein